jgi:hypothetical protein
MTEATAAHRIKPGQHARLTGRPDPWRWKRVSNPRIRSSARLWEQLRGYFEVRIRAEKCGEPYFLAESGAKQGAPRKEAAGARVRNAVEDLNGGHRRAALGVGRLSHRCWLEPIVSQPS